MATLLVTSGRHQIQGVNTERVARGESHWAGLGLGLRQDGETPSIEKQG